MGVDHKMIESQTKVRVKRQPSPKNKYIHTYMTCEKDAHKKKTDHNQ